MTEVWEPNMAHEINIISTVCKESISESRIHHTHSPLRISAGHTIYQIQIFALG